MLKLGIFIFLGAICFFLFQNISEESLKDTSIAENTVISNKSGGFFDSITSNTASMNRSKSAADAANVSSDSSDLYNQETQQMEDIDVLRRPDASLTKNQPADPTILDCDEIASTQDVLNAFGEDSIQSNHNNTTAGVSNDTQDILSAFDQSDMCTATSPKSPLSSDVVFKKPFATPLRKGGTPRQQHRQGFMCDVATQQLIDDSNTTLQDDIFTAATQLPPDSSVCDDDEDCAPTQPYVADKEEEQDDLSNMPTQVFTLPPDTCRQRLDESLSDMATQPYNKDLNSDDDDVPTQDLISNLKAQPHNEAVANPVTSVADESISDLATQPYNEKRQFVKPVPVPEDISDIATQPFNIHNTSKNLSHSSLSTALPDESISELATQPYCPPATESKGSRTPEGFNGDELFSPNTNSKSASVNKTTENLSASNQHASSSSKSNILDESISNLATQPYREDCVDGKLLLEETISDLATQPFHITNQNQTTATKTTQRTNDSENSQSSVRNMCEREDSTVKNSPEDEMEDGPATPSLNPDTFYVNMNGEDPVTPNNTPLKSDETDERITPTLTHNSNSTKKLSPFKGKQNRTSTFVSNVDSEEDSDSSVASETMLSDSIFTDKDKAHTIDKAGDQNKENEQKQISEANDGKNLPESKTTTLNDSDYDQYDKSTDEEDNDVDIEEHERATAISSSPVKVQSSVCSTTKLNKSVESATTAEEKLKKDVQGIGAPTCEISSTVVSSNPSTSNNNINLEYSGYENYADEEDVDNLSCGNISFASDSECASSRLASALSAGSSLKTYDECNIATDTSKSAALSSTISSCGRRSIRGRKTRVSALRESSSSSDEDLSQSQSLFSMDLLSASPVKNLGSVEEIENKSVFVKGLASKRSLRDSSTPIAFSDVQDLDSASKNASEPIESFANDSLGNTMGTQSSTKSPLKTIRVTRGTRSTTKPSEAEIQPETREKLPTEKSPIIHYGISPVKSTISVQKSPAKNIEVSLVDTDVLKTRATRSSEKSPGKSTQISSGKTDLRGTKVTRSTKKSSGMENSPGKPYTPVLKEVKYSPKGNKSKTITSPCGSKIINNSPTHSRLSCEVTSNMGLSEVCADNIPTLNGSFQGFEKSPVNSKRKVSLGKLIDAKDAAEENSHEEQKEKCSKDEGTSPVAQRVNSPSNKVFASKNANKRKSSKSPVSVKHVKTSIDESENEIGFSASDSKVNEEINITDISNTSNESAKTQPKRSIRATRKRGGLASTGITTARAEPRNVCNAQRTRSRSRESSVETNASKTAGSESQKCQSDAQQSVNSVATVNGRSSRIRKRPSRYSPDRVTEDNNVGNASDVVESLPKIRGRSKKSTQLSGPSSDNCNVTPVNVNQPTEPLTTEDNDMDNSDHSSDLFKRPTRTRATASRKSIATSTPAKSNTSRTRSRKTRVSLATTEPIPEIIVSDSIRNTDARAPPLRSSNRKVNEVLMKEVDTATSQVSNVSETIVCNTRGARSTRSSINKVSSTAISSRVSRKREHETQENIVECDELRLKRSKVTEDSQERDEQPISNKAIVNAKQTASTKSRQSKRLQSPSTESVTDKREDTSESNELTNINTKLRGSKRGQSPANNSAKTQAVKETVSDTAGVSATTCNGRQSRRFLVPPPVNSDLNKKKPDRKSAVTSSEANNKTLNTKASRGCRRRTTNRCGVQQASPLLTPAIEADTPDDDSPLNTSVDSNETFTSHTVRQPYRKSASSALSVTTSDLSMSLCLSPSARQSRASTKAKVLFTGIVPSREHQRVISKLGGSIVESATECSVLVAENCKRTCKLLACVARGVPVVTLQWLQTSSRANAFTGECNVGNVVNINTCYRFLYLKTIRIVLYVK